MLPSVNRHSRPGALPYLEQVKQLDLLRGREPGTTSSRQTKSQKSAELAGVKLAGTGALPPRDNRLRPCSITKGLERCT